MEFPTSLCGVLIFTVANPLLPLRPPPLFLFSPLAKLTKLCLTKLCLTKLCLTKLCLIKLTLTKLSLANLSHPLSQLLSLSFSPPASLSYSLLQSSVFPSCSPSAALPQPLSPTSHTKSLSPSPSSSLSLKPSSSLSPSLPLSLPSSLCSYLSPLP